MPDVSRYRELAKGNKDTFDGLIKPPYSFTVEFFEKTHQLSSKEMQKKILQKIKEDYKDEETVQKYKEFFGDIDESLNELYNAIWRPLNIDTNETLRLIEIEEDLINLVKNTDNNIFHRPLFFPTVFINNDIEYDGAIIKGILISEALVDEKNRHQLIYGDLYKKYGKNANDYEIASIIIDTKYGMTNVLLMSLITEKKTVSGLTDYDIRQLNIKNFVRNIVVNIVDMVEGIDRDLSVVVIETTKEQNLKKIQRGQLPFPTKVYIRAQGEFKKYVQRFNTDVKEYEDDTERHKILFKFMVRGHYRHFRAERYKRETKAKPKWIKPFWKGEGIPIAKEYKLVH